MAVRWDVWENLKLMLELDAARGHRMDGTTYNYFVDWVARNRLAVAEAIGFMEGERKFYEIRVADHVNDGDGYFSVDQWWRRGTFLLPSLAELNDINSAAILWSNGFVEGRFDGIGLEGEHDYSLWFEIDQLAYLEISLAEGIDFLPSRPVRDGREDDVSRGRGPHRMPSQRQGYPQTYDAHGVEDATGQVVDDIWELIKHQDIDGLYDVLFMLDQIFIPGDPDPYEETNAERREGNGGRDFTVLVDRCHVEARAALFKQYVSAQAVANAARVEYDALPLSMIDHEEEEEAEDEPTFNDTARIVADRLIAAGTGGFEPQASHFNQRAAELHDILQRIADIGTEAVVVGLFNSVLEAGEGLEISRFSHALNYAAAYEDANLQDLNDEWTHLEENTTPEDEEDEEDGD